MNMKPLYPRKNQVFACYGTCGCHRTCTGRALSFGLAPPRLTPEGGPEKSHVDHSGSCWGRSGGDDLNLCLGHPRQRDERLEMAHVHLRRGEWAAISDITAWRGDNGRENIRIGSPLLLLRRKTPCFPIAAQLPPHCCTGTPPPTATLVHNPLLLYWAAVIGLA